MTSHSARDKNENFRFFLLFFEFNFNQFYVGQRQLNCWLIQRDWILWRLMNQQKNAPSQRLFSQLPYFDYLFPFVIRLFFYEITMFIEIEDRKQKKQKKKIVKIFGIKRLDSINGWWKGMRIETYLERCYLFAFIHTSFKNFALLRRILDEIFSRYLLCKGLKRTFVICHSLALNSFLVS